MSVPKALSIAGSDSGGGAGIQADLKTFSAFRVFGMSVVTAVTAQNSLAVRGIVELAADFVALQIDTVLDDFGADAVKVGMLGNAAIVDAVGDRLRVRVHGPVVLDPVMAASTGELLLRDDARSAFVKTLLPLADLVTPNLAEAGLLAGTTVTHLADMEEAARRIVGLGARSVLVKGGHLTDSATDVLLHAGAITRFVAPRVPQAGAVHGTGCTYSAAIAANLARGRPVPDAVAEAKRYVTAALRERFHAGGGAAALRHFVGNW